MATSDSTTYCVYRIVCFATGKCYVGQTLDVRNRKKWHFGALKRGEHHSRYLQNSYHKYGSDAFYFESLEKGIPEDQIAKRESYWIHYFDSYHNGYNMTEGGEGAGNDNQSTPFLWNGIEYQSQVAAAKSLGVSPGTISLRKKAGYSQDTDVKRISSRSISVKWNNIEYATIADCARALNIVRSAMVNRIRKGYTCDNDMVGLPTPHSVTWNNTRYPSERAAAKAIGVAVRTLRDWLAKGWICDSDKKGTRK